MKTIRNKTHAPIRVPLPRGKVLHLGPDQEGKIAHTDVDHPPLQRLVNDKVIEILDDRSVAATEREREKGPHTDTHGHHSPSGSSGRGDR